MIRPGRNTDLMIEDKVLRIVRGHGCDDCVPKYSEEFTAAVIVVVGMAHRMPQFGLRRADAKDGLVKWTAAFGEGDNGKFKFQADADTAPLAICRAALMAVGE